MSKVPTAKSLNRKLMIRKNIPLYIMLIIPILFFLIFCYGPMLGLVMAFQDFKLTKGFLGSEWVGWMNFKLIFSTPNIRNIILNTLRLGLMSVFIQFPFPIILAIMLNEVSNKIFKKLSQTILYLPHFFSWVILGGLVITCFSFAGPVNNLIEMLGGEKFGFMTNTSSWLGIYVGTGIWKEVGYEAIVYLAALTSIDPTYYEAAKIDGASKWQQITNITIPCLMPTIVLMLILAAGKVTTVGFDRVYTMMNTSVASVADVVSTFSYEFGIRGGNFSIATAMGMFDSLLGLILVLITNKLAKRAEMQLF